MSALDSPPTQATSALYPDKAREKYCVPSDFIVIEGNPVAWQRPRQSTKGIFYDSQKKHKEKYRTELLAQSSRWEKIEGPLLLECIFHMPIPSTLSKKKKKELFGEPHYKKPDLSNLLKFVEDAFQGLLFEDDKQIVEIHALKWYSSDAATFIRARKYEI